MTQRYGSIRDPLNLATVGQPNFAVRHDGKRVTLSFDVSDDYEAMLFVDKFEFEMARKEAHNVTVFWNVPAKP